MGNVKEDLLCYFSGLNFLLMTPIAQPDTNHSTKNDVDFRETLPLIWALSAFSVNARFRPLPPPANPTLLWLVTFLEARSRPDLTRHMGERQECLYVDDFPEMWTSESQTLSRVFSALHSHPRLSAGSTSKCMSLFDTLVWLNMTINHYNSAYRS